MTRAATSAGTTLRRRVTKDIRDNGLVLDPKELALLEHACRVADLIAALDAAVDQDGAVTVNPETGMVHAHPALSESRQHRALLARLLSGINLAVPTPKDVRKSEAGKRGASARWSA